MPVVYHNLTPSNLEKNPTSQPVVVGPSVGIPVIFQSSTPITPNFPYNGLIAYWNFDGDWIDSTGNGHNGSGSSLLFISGLIRQGISGSLNTSSLTIINQIAGDYATGSFTIAGWIGGIEDYGGITGVRPGMTVWRWGNRSASLAWDKANNVTYYVTSGSTTYSSSATGNWLSSTWAFFAFTMDNSIPSSSFYVRPSLGNPLSVTTGADGIVPNVSIDSQGIGLTLSSIDPNTTPPQPQFTMDEMGIWNRVLSRTELDYLYNSGSGSSF